MSESPLFAAPSAPFSPKSPLRTPLSPLSVSAAGNRSCHWPPALRPLPSPDKENLNAFQDAIESRNRYFIFQFEEISRQIHILRLADAQATSAFTMANPASALPHTRLSMPEISDDSESEPDVSILGMARERLRARESGNRSTAIPRGLNMAPEHLQAHDTSVEDEDEDLETVDEEEEDEGEEHDAEQEVDELIPLIDPATMGLKEISNLGRFTVSSHKQGNGVEELRNDDLNMYWQ
jgi:anaphase-promoting complex subunit 10